VNFSLYIAKRYLFSKNSNNAINIISSIATVGVIGGSLALLLVLSVFSGLKSFSGQFLKATDPDIRIEAVHGKSFFYTDSLAKIIEGTTAVIAHSKTIEERAYFNYNKKELIAYVKGVDSNYTQVVKMDTLIYMGHWISFDQQSAVVGNGIARKLSLGILNYGEPLQIYVPKPGKKYSTLLKNTFNRIHAQALGVYSISQELDDKYVYIPLDLCQELLNYQSNQIRSIDLKTTKEGNAQAIASLKKALGDRFKVSSQEELNAVFYKILNTEKLVAYLIFTLVLVLAVFNVIGSIIMMILDKKGNLKTLYNLGASVREIKQIFVLQGFLMTLLGLVVGTSLGILFIALQNKFQWFMITETIAYPIELKGSNLLLVWGTISVLGYAAAKIASSRISKALVV
jgi:lipoprotein-releasing system permease protein